MMMRDRERVKKLGGEEKREKRVLSGPTRSNSALGGRGGGGRLLLPLLALHHVHTFVDDFGDGSDLGVQFSLDCV